MKKIEFYKYQGTGNDFILIDNRENFFPKEDKRYISYLCHRHFGIGSDGLILIENAPEYDFKMVFFNPDASQSMCGNGGRCAVAFAHQIGIQKQEYRFLAIDGEHQAKISENGVIHLKMNDVEEIEKHSNYAILNTGSPHYVTFEKGDIDQIDVKRKGADIRYKHSVAGINVNFVEQISENSFKVRTYERGVEDETFSCGTGVTAVAIAMHKLKKTSQEEVFLQTKGGELKVSFQMKKRLLGFKTKYQNIWLSAEVKQIFKGEIVCDY